MMKILIRLLERLAQKRAAARRKRLIERLDAAMEANRMTSIWLWRTV